MIAVRDLQIGDFINTENNGVVQITVLSWKGVGYEGGASTPEHCSYIPLTDDILVKNGFIFNKGYAVLQVSEDTYLDFYKHEHRLRKVWEGIDEWNNHAKIRDVSFVCQCYYVHEFQHALRLCGVEKSIIL